MRVVVVARGGGEAWRAGFAAKAWAVCLLRGCQGRRLRPALSTNRRPRQPPRPGGREVLGELRRLMPGKDPVATLLARGGPRASAGAAAASTGAAAGAAALGSSCQRLPPPPRPAPRRATPRGCCGWRGGASSWGMTRTDEGAHGTALLSLLPRRHSCVPALATPLPSPLLLLPSRDGSSPSQSPDSTRLPLPPRASKAF